MRVSFLPGVLLLMTACFACAEEVRLSAEQRESEAAWLASLGLKVPPGGPLLERPFDPPYTFRSFLAPTAWWREPFPREISAADLRADLPVLRAVMERAYGGWHSAEARGWQWRPWFDRWEQALAARGDAKLSPAEALAPLATLMEFQLDNHSGPVGAPVRFGSGSSTAVLASDPEGACAAVRTADNRETPLNALDRAQLPKKARIIEGADLEGADLRERSGYYIAYPSRRGRATAVYCGAKWIAARVIDTPDSGLEESPAYRALADGIGYLRLPTFSKQNGERLRALLPGLPETAGHEKVLIVDLRGNDGGDAPIEAIARWVDLQSVRPAFKFERHQPKSCLYDALRWGYTQVTTQNLKPPISEALRRSLQAQLDGLFAPSPEGCPARMEDERSPWNYTKHRYPSEPAPGKPRILVLVDNFCGSDCEYLTYVLAANPGSVIAGQNTFGVGQFIQPGYFILPHSRVKFRIALGMSDNYGDGRSFDGYGLDVDVVLDGEARGTQQILKFAQRLAQ
jgi:hypothetical protein